MRIFIITIFFLFPGIKPVYSQEFISLEQIIKEVKANNPEIKASEKLFEAYKNRIPQSYYPSNPVLEFEKMYLPDSNEKNFIFKQEIVNPYKFFIQNKIFKKEANYYQQLFYANVNRIILETRKTFYRYYLAEKYERIFKETADILTGVSKIAESKYAVGHSQVVDVLKAQVELSKTLNMIVTIRQEKEIAIALLNSLMDRDIKKPLPPPEGLIKNNEGFDFTKLQAISMKTNPEIKAMEINISRTQDLLKFAKTSWLPDFMWLYRKRSSDNASMNNTYDFSLGLTLPLFYTKNNSFVKQANAEKEMIQSQYSSLKNKISFEIKNAITKLETNLRLIKLYETTVIPQAEQSMKIAISGYQANKIDFIDVLDTIRTLLDFKKEYYAYIVEYHIWKAELSNLMGESLWL